jgi:hypothetical protein
METASPLQRSNDRRALGCRRAQGGAQMNDE